MIIFLYGWPLNYLNMICRGLRRYTCGHKCGVGNLNHLTRAERADAGNEFSNEPWINKEEPDYKMNRSLEELMILFFDEDIIPVISLQRKNYGI